MLGKLDTAAALYRRAMRNAPNDTTLQGDLGMILIAQEKPGEARPHLEAAYASNPKNARYAGALGLIALTEGDTQEAMNRFVESLLIDSDNEELMRHAIALAKELDRFPEIDGMLRSFCEFRPGHIEMNTELAERLLDSGYESEAIERLETVLMVESTHQRAQKLLDTARLNAHEKSA